MYLLFTRGIGVNTPPSWYVSSNTQLLSVLPFLQSCFMGLEGFGVDALSYSTFTLNLVWGHFNAGNALVQHCPMDTSLMMGKSCRDREMFFACATCCTRETLHMCLLSLRNWFSISLHVNYLNFKLKQPQVARGPRSSLSSFLGLLTFRKGLSLLNWILLIGDSQGRCLSHTLWSSKRTCTDSTALGVSIALRGPCCQK